MLTPLLIIYIVHLSFKIKAKDEEIRLLDIDKNSLIHMAFFEGLRFKYDDSGLDKVVQEQLKIYELTQDR